MTQKIKSRLAPVIFCLFGVCFGVIADRVIIQAKLDTAETAKQLAEQKYRDTHERALACDRELLTAIGLQSRFIMAFQRFEEACIQ